jgi:hypothetical protein
MDRGNCRASAFRVLLLLAGLSASMVVERQDIDLTALPNAAAIVNNLQYTANCTAAALWVSNLPLDTAGLVKGAGNGSSSINIAFLRASLPSEYQNSSDTALAEFYNDMSSGSLFNLEWLGTAIDDVEAVCLAPTLEKNVSIDRLNATQNCTATAHFLSDTLGWINETKPYDPSISANDSSWLDFIYYALPPAVQNNITDVELDVFYDHISTTATSGNDTALVNFLTGAWNSCKDRICTVQGYTGNPDIGGIGVSPSPPTSFIANFKSGSRVLHCRSGPSNSLLRRRQRRNLHVRHTWPPAKEPLSFPEGLPSSLRRPSRRCPLLLPIYLVSRLGFPTFWTIVL